MSIAVAHGYDAQVIGLEDAGHAGPPSKRIITGYGFWIFLLSDIVMFSCFFAAYAVLSGQTAGGPTGPELFNLRNVAIETAIRRAGAERAAGARDAGARSGCRSTSSTA